MKILIPGSFDPPTNGHIDVINRCSEIFSEIIVGAVSYTHLRAHETR